MSIVYRDAAGADAAALAAFSQATFEATFAHLYPREDLAAFVAEKYGAAIQAAEIADPHIHYRLAVDGAALVGYCKTGPMGLEIARPPRERALELHRLYVDERVKGAGVAHTLMQEALAWACGQGGEALYLSVWEDNHRAQAFYRRYGFVHVGEHGFKVGAVVDRDFIWRLAL